ncbi:MAG: methyltransferase domain-containing protein [Promethearchaeota archaeon]|jgi:2-polyprenyl-3-methyl-5-hydroxy-6-metoxy-1,4-benzoquinol methylase
MNSKKERQKILSDYDHVFANERAYYSQKKPGSKSDYDLEREQFFKKANIKLKNLLGNVSGKKILDVGCGTGTLSFYLAQNGADVIGIDLSKNFVVFCKAEAKRLGLSVEFKEMNAQILDFPDKTFDIIVGSRVVHHIPDVKLFFKETRRLLKKNGFIAFIEPLKKNPIVELNRKFFAPKERTRHEHPLFISDVKHAERIFKNLEYYVFFLLSPLAMFFKRFIRKNILFKISYKALNFIEKPLYKIKMVQNYCWQIVFKSRRIL